MVLFNEILINTIKIEFNLISAVALLYRISKNIEKT